MNGNILIGSKVELVESNYSDFQFVQNLQKLRCIVVAKDATTQIEENKYYSKSKVHYLHITNVDKSRCFLLVRSLLTA